MDCLTGGELFDKMDAKNDNDKPYTEIETAKIIK